MHNVGLFFCCLFLAADGWSDQKTRDNTLFERRISPQSNRPAIDQGKFSELSALASLLLAATPESAFTPDASLARQTMGNPTSAGLQAPLRHSRVAMQARPRKKTKKEKRQGKAKAKLATRGFGGDTKYSGEMRPWERYPGLEVPAGIKRPDYADTEEGMPIDEGLAQVEKKSSQDIQAMKESALVAREALDAAGRALAVNMSLDEIDRIVHQEIIERDAYPSFLNYRGFPRSCCTSVNEVMEFGIPDSYRLQDGDIVTISVSAYKNGFHSDLKETFLVGNVDEESKQLVKVAWEATEKAAKYCEANKLYKGIGSTIEDYLVDFDYRSAQSFSGNGIGKAFHMTPLILQCRDAEMNLLKMEVGHTFVINPVVSQGSAKEFFWEDGWVAASRDGSRSAHFGHTYHLTRRGAEALTARLPTSQRFWWESEEDFKAATAKQPDSPFAGLGNFFDGLR